MSRCLFIIFLLLFSIVAIPEEECINARAGDIISIDGEEELKSSTYTSSGSGTITNPFILTGFPQTTEGISLRNLTSHVIIKDHSFDTSTEAIAVMLKNVEHCTLDNISISSHDHTVYAIGRTNLTLNNSMIRDIPSRYKVEVGNNILPLKLYFKGILIICNSTFRERVNSSGIHCSIEIEANRIIVKNSTFQSHYYLPLYANEDYLLVEDSTFLGTNFRPRNYGTPPIERCLIRNCTFINTYIQLHWACDLKIINNSFTGPGSYIFFGSPLNRPDWIRNEIRGNTFEGSKGLFSDFPNNNDFIVNWNVTENYFANSSFPAIEWRGESVRGIRVWKNVFYHNRGTGDIYNRNRPQVYIETNVFPSDDINMSVNGVGNYWRDLTTPDEDGNGIVDTPYLIDDNSQWPNHDSFYDYFPVANPYFDLTKPYLRILEPVEDETCMKYVVVRWEAWDHQSGLDSVLVSLDGENWAQPANDSSTSFILDEGYHTIYVKAIDRAGLYNVSTRRIYIALIDKAVRIINPEQGEFLDSEVVEVEWYINPVFDIMEQELIVNGEKMYLNKGARTTQIFLSEGDHFLSMICRDNFGTFINETVFFTVDLYEPMISIYSPHQNITYSNEDFKFNWDITDRNGIRSTHFRIDEDEWIQTGGQGPFQNTTFLEEGAHSFEVRAVDNASRSSERKVEFSIGPCSSLEITSPMDGTITAASSIEVRWEMKNGFLPSKYIVSNEMKTYEMALLNTHHWDVPLLLNSENRIEITAYDPFDNYLTGAVTIINDNEGPTVTIFDQTPYRNGNKLIISWSGSDNYRLSEFLISIDGGDWKEVNNEFSLEGLEEGVHSITIRCLDIAGNYGEDCYFFILDTIPPEVGFSSDVEQVILHSSFMELEWYAEDDEGIDRSVLWIDDMEYNLSEDERDWKGYLKDGPHYLKISTFDIAGNSASDTLSVLVDTLDPELHLFEEIPRYTNRTLYFFKFEAKDNLGLSFIRISLSGEDVWTENEPGEFLVPITFEDGPHIITMEVMDISGRSSLLNATMTVDTAPPIPISLNYTYDNGMLKVHYKAEDSLSGIKEMYFDTYFFNDTVVESEGTMNLGRVSPGTIHIKWTLIDNADNWIAVERDLEIKEPQGEGDECLLAWIIALIIFLIILLSCAGVFTYFHIKKRKGDKSNHIQETGPPVPASAPQDINEYRDSLKISPENRNGPYSYER